MIVALQYYEGDREQTMRLACLLADLEPLPRNDIMLALICQPDTPNSKLTDDTLKYCSSKFSVQHVRSSRGAPKWPEACGELWAGTMEHFSTLSEKGQCPHNTIFTLDGGDTIPLHKNWIGIALEEHSRTLCRKRLITGTPNSVGTPLLINPNMILDLSIWSKYPNLHHIPRYDGTVHTCFDVWHRMTFLKETSPSSIVLTEWRGGGKCLSPGILKLRSQRSLWLHGYKDENMHDMAREFLLSSNHPPPVLMRHNLDKFVVS